jgi:CBS domain-containing protein
MQIIDIMTKDIIVLHESDTLKTAIERMNEAHIHHLIVVSSDGRLQGILSDRDLHMATQSPFALKDANTSDDILTRMTVGKIMTHKPHSIEPNFSIQDAVSIMLEKRINALPVVHDQTIVGIVTSTDLLRVLANENV